MNIARDYGGTLYASHIDGGAGGLSDGNKR